MSEHLLEDAAKALEEVNEANLLLEHLLADEVRKTASLKMQVEAYKAELYVALKAITELKKKHHRSNEPPLNAVERE